MTIMTNITPFPQRVRPMGIAEASLILKGMPRTLAVPFVDLLMDLGVDAETRSNILGESRDKSN